jgi:CRP-like cAMP-binding protein
MNSYLPMIRTTKLFCGVSDEEILKMLGCLHARTAVFEKHTYIVRKGDIATSIGMVLEGDVLIIEEDFWGNRNILSRVSAGQLFAEAYASAGITRLDVGIVAGGRCTVLFMDTAKMMNACATPCLCHTHLMLNLVGIIAQKNIDLVRKIKHMSQRSLRAKLLSFLSEQSNVHGSASFEIPFDRQQLADYLAVDRSALSNELSKMRRDGILEYDRKKFQLKRQP